MPMVPGMGAAPDTVDAATPYFSILTLGFVPTVLPIATSALLPGVGDARTSMRCNVTVNLVDVVFNYLLIVDKFGFPALGVNGATLATVIGDRIACVVATRAIAGKRSGHSEANYETAPTRAFLPRILYRA